MKTRTQLRLLYILAITIAVAGLLVLADQLVTGIRSPVDINRLTENDQPPVSIEPANVTLEDFAPLWNKRLQGKPELPPPIAPDVAQEKPRQASQPQVPLPNLTGILHSASFSLAQFDVGGKSVSCAVGEVVEGATVEKIDPDKVTIFRDRTFVLDLE